MPGMRRREFVSLGKLAAFIWSRSGARFSDGPFYNSREVKMLLTLRAGHWRARHGRLLSKSRAANHPNRGGLTPDFELNSKIQTSVRNFTRNAAGGGG